MDPEIQNYFCVQVFETVSFLYIYYIYIYIYIYYIILYYILYIILYIYYICTRSNNESSFLHFHWSRDVWFMDLFNNTIAVLKVFTIRIQSFVLRSELQIVLSCVIKPWFGLSDKPLAVLCKGTSCLAVHLRS